MSIEPGDRMFAGLPAVFRDRDVSGDLARLLAVFEALFFGGSGGHASALPGIERQLPAIPALFAPRAGEACQGTTWRTPDGFLHWLADWLAFTPHALFHPDALRRILAGIVPLYGWRGTRRYLEELLALCFGSEGIGVTVEDRPRVGFSIGEASVLGVDTRLGRGRSFWFKVIVHMPAARAGGRAALERQLRAVIDFAKPAHTAYELQWGKPARPLRADEAPPDPGERTG